MDRQKQRAAAGRVRAQEGGHLARLPQVEAVERFVRQQHGLRRQEADGQEDALPFTLRERADRLREQAIQIELLDEVIAERRGASKEPDREVQRPPHRLRRPRCDTIGQIKQQRRAFAGREPSSPGLYETRIGRQKARETLEERRLAGAVGTNQAEHFARSHFEANIRQGRKSPEPFGQAEHGEQRCRRQDQRIRPLTRHRSPSSNPRHCGFRRCCSSCDDHCDSGSAPLSGKPGFPDDVVALARRNVDGVRLIPRRWLQCLPIR
jgi:hypothetical protein